MIWILLAAAGDASKPIDWNYLVNYGILGLFVLAAATGKFIVFRRELDAANAQVTILRTERDDERKARNELEVTVRDKYVPALEASKTTLESTLKFMQERMPT